jgi:hypothetical protein
MPLNTGTAMFPICRRVSPASLALVSPSQFVSPGRSTHGGAVALTWRSHIAINAANTPGDADSLFKIAAARTT